MSSPSSLSSRTPPHLKWLLNERAALSAQVEARMRTVRILQEEVAKLSTQIAAIDETFGAFAPDVDPAAAGQVRATKGKYGQHGGLTKFILEQLRQAGPLGVSTQVLLERLVVRFQVCVHTEAERRSVRATIGRTLRDLKSQGFIEIAQVSRGGHRPQVWRIRQAATLDELRSASEGGRA